MVKHDNYPVLPSQGQQAETQGSKPPTFTPVSNSEYVYGQGIQAPNGYKRRHEPKIVPASTQAQGGQAPSIHSQPQSSNSAVHKDQSHQSETQGSKPPTSAPVFNSGYEYGQGIQVPNGNKGQYEYKSAPASSRERGGQPASTHSQPQSSDSAVHKDQVVVNKPKVSSPSSYGSSNPAEAQAAKQSDSSSSQASGQNSQPAGTQAKIDSLGGTNYVRKTEKSMPSDALPHGTGNVNDRGHKYSTERKPPSTPPMETSQEKPAIHVNVSVFYDQNGKTKVNSTAPPASPPRPSESESSGCCNGCCIS